MWVWVWGRGWGGCRGETGGAGEDGGYKKGMPSVDCRDGGRNSTKLTDIDTQELTSPAVNLNGNE